MTEIQNEMEQMTIFDVFPQDTWCGRMSPEHYHQTTAKTSKPCLQKSSESVSLQQTMFLYMVGGADRLGLFQEQYSEYPTDALFPSPTEYMMHSFGEYPKEERESHLWQILTAYPHPKYYLSAKACQGILNRARKRKKQLPELLEAVLIRQSQSVFKNDQENPGGGKGILIQNDHTGALSTLNNQYVLSSTTVDVEIEVETRKYPVDTDALSKCLRDHKILSVDEIAEKLNKPKTMVEHWFRKDKCFSIPDADIWFDLKQLLKIETDEFDKAITTFETKAGAYDMRNRIHMGDTSPTLTANQNAFYCIEGNGQRPSHRGDGYIESDKMYTLNTTEVHGVAYSVDDIGGGGIENSECSEKSSHINFPKEGGDNRIVTCTYSQDAYDQYSPSDLSASLRATGGSYGGGSESLIVSGQGKFFMCK